jgi:hypothetical protein
MSEMVEWADDGSAANEPLSPTFHDFGVRVPPGADYVTESGQRVENRSDRVMEFAPHPGSWEREQMLRRAQNVILDAANARIAALEADNYDLATMLAAERDRVAALLSSVSRETPFATHAEAELVERAMPANALKHSR